MNMEDFLLVDLKEKSSFFTCTQTLIEFSFGVALPIFMFNSSGQSVFFFNKIRELWQSMCRIVFSDAAAHFVPTTERSQ